MKIKINKEKLLTKSNLTNLTQSYKSNEVPANLVFNNSIFYNPQTNSDEIYIENLIDKLECNKILSYPHDFLSLEEDGSKIKNEIVINLVDNVNHEHLSDDFEHYNFSTGEITITEKLLFNQQFLPTNFAEELYASVGQHKLLNFAIFHEIGHAIQHQLYLHQEGQFLNSQDENLGNQNALFNFIKLNSMSIENQEHNSFSLHRAVGKSISEGFADLYACICIKEFYEENVAIPFIEEVIGARQRSKDYYYSDEIMMRFLKDIKSNHIQFNDFEDMKNYMNESISKYTLDMMVDKFLSTNETQIQHNNQFLGYIKSTLKKPDLTQCQNSQDIIAVLKEFIPDLAKCSHMEIKNKDFTDGINKGAERTKERNLSKDSLTQYKILQKIIHLRTNEKNHFQLTFK